MSRVKALMIGRLVLAWLWTAVWLVTLPGAQAGTLRLASDAPVALVSAAAVDNQQSHDLVGIHHRSTARSTRRFETRIAANDSLAALWFFQVEVARAANASHSCDGSHACPGLANNWQFLLRTASSPRAPSFVS